MHSDHIEHVRPISFQNMEAITLQTIYQTVIQSVFISGDENCRMVARL